MKRYEPIQGGAIGERARFMENNRYENGDFSIDGMDHDQAENATEDELKG